MIRLILKYSFLVTVLSLLEFSFVYAHPGRTDSSGGHTCRTNCGSWGLEYGEYHYHNSGYTPPATTTPTVKTPKVEYKTIIETENIDFKTETLDDQNINKGEEKVRQDGENGVKSISYRVTYTDGIITNKEKVSEATAKEPKTKIIAKGTKETAPTEIVNNKTDNKPSNSWLIWLLVILGIVGLLTHNNKTKDDQKKQK